MSAVSPARPRATRAAPVSRPLPSVASLALARAQVEIVQFFRERDAVVFIFAYPIVMMAIFASVFSQELEMGPGVRLDFARYFLPGIAATGVMLSSFQTTAIDLAVQRDSGALKRLRGTPLPATAFFAGKVLQVLVNTVVQMALLLGLAAFAFDVDMPDAQGWLTFAWVLALGAAVGTVWGVAFSGVPRTGRSASAVVTPVVLVLQFISGVFFAFHQLPDWMQQVAALFPLKWMAQGMRAAFLPDAARLLEPAGSWELGAVAAILAAWLVVGLVLGPRTFRWRRHDDG